MNEHDIDMAMGIVGEAFPGATWELDNEGQVVIYTDIYLEGK